MAMDVVTESTSVTVRQSEVRRKTGSGESPPPGPRPAAPSVGAVTI